MLFKNIKEIIEIVVTKRKLLRTTAIFNWKCTKAKGDVGYERKGNYTDLKKTTVALIVERHFII